jgi:hypothetical protein
MTMLNKTTLALVFAIAVILALPASVESSFAGPYCVPHGEIGQRQCRESAPRDESPSENLADAAIWLFCRTS